MFRIADLRLSERPAISVITVLGDGSSVLHVMENQTFFIEYQEYTRRRSFPPVNFKVDYGGELMLVSDFHVAGKNNPAFELEGRITGVSNLSLTESRVLRAGENMSSALLKDKVYIETPIDGQLKFGVFIMEASSGLYFAKRMKFVVSTLYMRQKAVISADKIHMALNEVHMEGSSRITTSGKGPKAGEGLGPGSSFSNVGSGGGHGGQGGPGSTFDGGSGYGSYVYPVHPGSGGGGDGGGAGGCTTEVKVSHY